MSRGRAGKRRRAVAITRRDRKVALEPDHRREGVEIMDRNEALKLLRGGEEGISEWNRRRQSGETIPDLSEVVLDRATLSGINLSGTNLHWADLDLG